MLPFAPTPASGPPSAIGSRFLEILAARLGKYETERYLTDIGLELEAAPPDDNLKFVTFCADNQASICGNYSKIAGKICLRSIEILGKKRASSWQATIASLRLLEGVLLISMVDEEDKALLCQAIQSWLRSRFLPRQATARLESAVMALSDPNLQEIFAPRRPNYFEEGDKSEQELLQLVNSLRPTQDEEVARQKTYEAFDTGVFQCFGCHGECFGSAVNGFQLRGSDLDIVVMLPEDIQSQLVEEARQRRDRDLAEEADRANESEGSDEKNVNASDAAAEKAEQKPTPRWTFESTLDWSFVNSKKPQRAACVAAAWALASALRRAGLEVIEVITSARVPIVKCRHTPEGYTLGAIEVDISFCNELAPCNSRLLRTYAEFDGRARALVILVKLWAKRRKLNSPLDGTLSSYAYSLMVIHYLQRKGVLPNLQCPSAEGLAALNIQPGQPVPEKIIDGGHNVWFADPATTVPAPSISANDIAPASPRFAKRWLGAESPKLGILELLYGFFRYYSIEFNLYNSVVSIRWPTDAKVDKLNYFLTEAARATEANEEEDEENVLLNKPLNATENSEDDDEIDNVAATGNHMETPTQTPTQTPQITPALAPSQPAEYVELTNGSHSGLPAAMDSSDDDLQGASSCSSPVKALVRRWTLGRDGADDPSLASALTAAAKRVGDSGEPLSDAEGISNTSNDAALSGKDAEAVGLEVVLPLAEGMCIGDVRSFNAEHGFGFISCDATYARYTRDVFLHQKQAAGITVGDRVVFLVELNLKGQPQARQVRKLQPEEEETMLKQPIGAVDATEGGKGPELPAPSNPHSAYLAQTRIKSRQCLCIDDPLERLRTLGTNFVGQEIISSEMRRATSLLKKGREGMVEELLKDSRSPSTSSQPNPLRRRDFSPIPSHVMWRDQHTGGQRLITHHSQSIDKDAIGKVIGKKGTTIKLIQAESGVDEAHIDENNPDGRGPSIHLKGSPDCVLRALELLENIMGGAPPRRPSREQQTAVRSSPKSTYDVAADDGGKDHGYLTPTAAPLTSPSSPWAERSANDSAAQWEGQMPWQSPSSWQASQQQQQDFPKSPNPHVPRVVPPPNRGRDDNAPTPERNLPPPPPPPPMNAFGDDDNKWPNSRGISAGLKSSLPAFSSSSKGFPKQHAATGRLAAKIASLCVESSVGNTGEAFLSSGPPPPPPDEPEPATKAKDAREPVRRWGLNKSSGFLGSADQQQQQQQQSAEPAPEPPVPQQPSSGDLKSMLASFSLPSANLPVGPGDGAPFGGALAPEEGSGYPQNPNVDGQQANPSANYETPYGAKKNKIPKSATGGNVQWESWQ